MVLATDMTNHFEHISKFKNKINGDGLDVKDHNSRMLVMDYAIKCGDISNAAKASHLAMNWTALVMEEFFRQVRVL
jgi:high affinity cAMP-specific and IBMX-insensitive 3',5'-cyclic phosphodiesterase 8